LVVSTAGGSANSRSLRDSPAYFQSLSKTPFSPNCEIRKNYAEIDAQDHNGRNDRLGNEEGWQASIAKDCL
jgi:hypothetical protein